MAAVLLYVCSAFVVWLCVFHSVQADRSSYYSCARLGLYLDCSGSGLLNVPKGIPEWNTRLELQNNGIEEIREGDFHGLGNLSYLDLSHNDIRRIDGSVFKDLKKLRILKLDANKLTEIPFFLIPLNITKLTMAENHVTKIPAAALTQMPELMTLDLSGNNILGITNGSFQANSKLMHLNLNNNKIAHVDRGSMNNLTGLKILKMNRNELTELPARVLQNLTSLKTLELMRNKLRVIRGLTFDGLKELQTLKLKRNIIKELKDAAFWQLPSLTNLQMDHNEISNVTKGWLYDLKALKQLSLAYNDITKIDTNAWFPCQYLEKLDLSHNKLAAITDKSLDHLSSLKQLNLDQNDIARIDGGAFRALTYLTVLEINHNKINSAMEDVAGVFHDLVNLSKLGLRSNDIRSISVHAFSGLQELRVLHLEGNEITRIQENAFETLRELKELHINSSNLICDCDLAWLPQWSAMVRFQHSVLGHCFHPPLFRGVDLYQVDSAEFTCNDNEFPKPVILESPKSANVSKGVNMTLTCVTAINGNIQPNIRWKKDNKNLPESRSTVTASTDGEVNRYTSHLHLNNVQDSMKGGYQCHVRSEFGYVYSQIAYINVYVYPVFVKTPKNVTVQAGKTVELQCAAEGQPPPEIYWQKDGGGNFPAARERRMRMFPEDPSFFIVKTRVEDEGVYSCFAKNEAGVIVANATVTVWETPVFVEPMQMKKSTVRGESTVLQCLASGSPQPKLTWLKDDKELLMTDRHFFTEDNQVLVIMDTQWSDAGKYSCRVSNSLGTAKGATQLQVTDSGVDDDSTTTGIIIIAVVCCVVGTSLVWVIIIYQTRKRQDMYSATPTDETTLPGEVPSSGYISSDKEGSYTQGPITMAGYHYQDYQMKESGYESSSGQFRANGYLRPAIFPSDVDEDENQPPTLTAGDKLLRQMKAARSAQSLQYGGSDGDTIGSRHSTSSGQHSGGTSCSSSDPSGQWSAGGQQLQVDTNPTVAATNHHSSSCQPSPCGTIDDPPDYTTLQLLYSEGGGGGRTGGGGRGLLQTFHPTTKSKDKGGGGGRQGSSSRRGESTSSSNNKLSSATADRLRYHGEPCDKNPQYHCVACLQAQAASAGTASWRPSNSPEIHCTNNHVSCYVHKDSGSSMLPKGDVHSSPSKQLASGGDGKFHTAHPLPPPTQQQHVEPTSTSPTKQCVGCAGESNTYPHCVDCLHASGGHRTPTPCCCEVLRDSRYCPTPRGGGHQHMCDVGGAGVRTRHHPSMYSSSVRRSRSSNSIGRELSYCPHCDICPAALANTPHKECSSGYSGRPGDPVHCVDCRSPHDQGLTSRGSSHQGRLPHNGRSGGSPVTASPSIPASSTSPITTSPVFSPSSSSHLPTTPHKSFGPQSPNKYGQRSVNL